MLRETFKAEESGKHSGGGGARKVGVKADWLTDHVYRKCRGIVSGKLCF